MKLFKKTDQLLVTIQNTEKDNTVSCYREVQLLHLTSSGKRSNRQQNKDIDIILASIIPEAIPIRVVFYVTNLHKMIKW